jgi:hypothetical protein
MPMKPPCLPETAPAGVILVHVPVEVSSFQTSPFCMLFGPGWSPRVTYRMPFWLMTAFCGLRVPVPTAKLPDGWPGTSAQVAPASSD